MSRCGFIAVLGAPNAGKSTLINRLTGSKVTIVSPKPQTTRNRILGILVKDDAQFIFVDTPGIFAPRRRLDRAMVAAAWSGAGDADVIVLLIDASRKDLSMSLPIIEELKKRGQTAIIVLNKVDVAPKPHLLALAADIEATGIAEEIFMISAVTGDGTADLLAALRERLPAGPFHYPEDQLTDMPERLLSAEIVREHLFRNLHQEVPYELAVEPETWENFQNGSVKIQVRIVVARDSQRGIVLGAQGKTIKRIREAAQRELHGLLGRPVHLFLHVQSDPQWQDRQAYYRLWNLDWS
ncbi:MAG TPA: GTPase Era [Dongiaceae bacterium]|jgi:GTP-binding protein Era|nr:GTPase Era [Dongiaceae bacterium]